MTEVETAVPNAYSSETEEEDETEVRPVTKKQRTHNVKKEFPLVWQEGITNCVSAIIVEAQCVKIDPEPRNNYLRFRPNGAISKIQSPQNEDWQRKNENYHNSSQHSRTKVKLKRKIEEFQDDDYDNYIPDEYLDLEFEEDGYVDEDVDNGHQELYFYEDETHQINTKKEKKRPPVPEGKRSRASAFLWTKAESKTLTELVAIYGSNDWRGIAQIIQTKYNNNRTAAQCSQRWCRVINPSINKGPWQPSEDKLLLDQYDLLNGSWCKIVKHFPDRTDTQCKRRHEKLVQLGSGFTDLRDDFYW